MYNYVERSKEINELYLAISKTTKVLGLAGHTASQSNDGSELLKFHEVA